MVVVRVIAAGARRCGGPVIWIDVIAMRRGRRQVMHGGLTLARIVIAVSPVRVALLIGRRRQVLVAVARGT